MISVLIFVLAAFIFNQINSKRNMIGVRIHQQFLEQSEGCILLVLVTFNTHAIHSHSGVSSEHGRK